MKEKLCYVALDYDRELTAPATATSQANAPMSYAMPDGTIITLDRERFRSLEEGGKGE